MRSILTIACIVLSAVAVAWPVHADVSGRAQVTDGDSLKIGGTRLRLYGTDAPERGQGCHAEGERWLCGGFAKLRLKDRIAGRTVVCEERDQNRHKRVVAVCRVDGENLNAWMVPQHYVDGEADAKAAGLGLWRGEFVLPWDWRRGKRLPTVDRGTDRATPRTANRDDSECRIKGNISSKGTRIYHVPGGRYYEQTRISTSKGERWFCTEAEARKAGWRRSRR